MMDELPIEQTTMSWMVLSFCTPLTLLCFVNWWKCVAESQYEVSNLSQNTDSASVATLVDMTVREFCGRWLLTGSMVTVASLMPKRGDSMPSWWRCYHLHLWGAVVTLSCNSAAYQQMLNDFEIQLGLIQTQSAPPAENRKHGGKKSLGHLHLWK